MAGDLLTTQNAGGEAAKLADFLRRHPQAIYGDPSELAKDAGVSFEVVERAVRRASISAPAQDRPKPKATERRSVWEVIRSSWMWLTKDPAVVVVVTSAIFILTMMIFRNDGEITSRRSGMQFVINAAVPSIVFVLMLLFHMACYFRHARGKSVVRGSVALFVTASVATGIANLFGPSDGIESRLESILMPMVAFGFLCVFYALVAMFFSVLGGLWKVRTERVDRDRMSRQELLERLFDVQARLEENPEEVIQRSSWHNHPIAKEIESRLWEWCGVIGFGMTAITVLVAGAIMNRYDVDQDSLQYGLSVGGLGFIGMFLQLGISFLGRTIKRSILASLAYSGASLVAMLLPFGGFGPDRLIAGNGSQILGSLIGAVVLGFISGVGATIEAKATQERLMRANDPETLLVEYMDLQRRLNPGPREMTVMVVDAAKSSVMKSMADPYIAEWSFRAYQQLLERIAWEFDGEVMSTAGDGAVITFEDPHAALECSVELQKRIVEFNKTTNKLSMPFKLRIGLHRGTVVGQIDKVQYTDVIDIAAHVEAACLVGGIAVSQKVWEVLPGLRGEAIAMLIDGFVVYQLEFR